MRDRILLTIGTNTYIINVKITFVSNAQRGTMTMVEFIVYLTSDTEYLSLPSEQSLLKSKSASIRKYLMGHSSLKTLRAHIQQCLLQLVDFYWLFAESRYLSEEGLSDTLGFGIILSWLPTQQ